MTDIGAEYLSDLRDRFVSLRGQCERAAAQVGDDAFFAAPDAETNSIAINFKHVGGNLRSSPTSSTATARSRTATATASSSPTETRAPPSRPRGARAGPRWRARSRRWRRTT